MKPKICEIYVNVGPTSLGQETNRKILEIIANSDSYGQSDFIPVRARKVPEYMSPCDFDFYVTGLERANAIAKRINAQGGYCAKVEVLPSIGETIQKLKTDKKRYHGKR